jgi:hypothetical protein
MKQKSFEYRVCLSKAPFYHHYANSPATMAAVSRMARKVLSSSRDQKFEEAELVAVNTIQCRELKN